MKRTICAILSVLLLLVVFGAVPAFAEESFIAYLDGNDAWWAVNVYADVATPVTLNGNGTYVLSVTNTNTYDSAPDWNKMELVLLQPMDGDLYNEETLTIDSVQIGDRTVENVSYTKELTWRPDGKGGYAYAAVLAMDTSEFGSLAAGQSLVVTFTVNDGTPEETEPDTTDPDETEPDTTDPEETEPDTNDPNQNGSEPPKTGDDFIGASLSFALLLSALGIIMLFGYRRKLNN